MLEFPFIIQRFPQYRDSDTTPDDGQQQDVDTGFAVFPCRAAEGEADVLPAENREDEAGNIGSADKVPGKETLHTAIDGFRLGLWGKDVFERGEIDGLADKQCGDDAGEAVNSCFVPGKVLL